MGSLLISVITGAIIGWVGSLVMRTDTSAGIIGDIGVGAFSGVVAALALTSGYLLDALLAAALGATFVTGAHALVRHSQDA